MVNVGLSVYLCVLVVDTSLGHNATHLDAHYLIRSFDWNNRNVRPVINQSCAVNVYISMNLITVLNFDEVSQTIETVFWLTIVWFDELIGWDPEDYNGLDSIAISQDDVWKPDIALQNGVTELKQLGSKFMMVVIDFQGLILWYPFGVFKSRCSVDILYLPFDTQVCHMRFAAWSSTTEMINLNTSHFNITYKGFEENSEWKVENGMLKNLNDTFEPTVEFTFYLRRKPLFWIMNILLPIFILSILSLFVFVLPVDSGEKMSYTVTVLLAFVLFLTSVSSTLPRNSEVLPLISVYLLLLTILNSCITLVTIFVIRLYHCDENKPVTNGFLFVVCLYQRLFCKRFAKIEPVTDGDTKVPDWKDVSRAVNGVSFVILSVMFMFCNFLLIAIATA